MEWRKRIRLEKDGVSLAVDINAAVAVNQSETGATNKVESVSHVRVAQDARRPPPHAGKTATPKSGAEIPETEQEDADD